MDEKTKQLTKHFEEIIRLIDPDPKREGLTKTPARAAKALSFLTSGSHDDINSLVNDAIFTTDHQGMVVVKDIEFYSLCEHHILPFHGSVDVGYIPNGKVIGLSKIPRIIDHFAKRLQIQENMTSQIAHALVNLIHTKDVAVTVRAKHSCMCMRGVAKQNAFMLSSSMLGQFLDNPITREEFFRLTQER